MVTRKSNVAKTNRDQKMRDIIALAKLQNFEAIEQKYPGDWIRDGAKLKAHYLYQKKPQPKGQKPHIWILGEPGTG
jgi:hypothetical protein